MAMIALRKPFVSESVRVRAGLHRQTRAVTQSGGVVANAPSFRIEHAHHGAILFMTHLKEGGFYGWPWYYIGDMEDPALKGKRPDLKGRVQVPEVLIQAHSAALSAAFYDREAFPAEYRGDAFVALHGSQSRPERTGYKVIRVRMKGGRPTGEYEDFMTGFIVDNDSVWGRPAGVAVTRDGALLVSDDANGTIFRVTRR